MRQIDLLIHNAAQLLTCASPNGVKRGATMREVGMIPNGAVAIDGGRIVAVGESSEMLAAFSASRLIDASGKSVMPGFVDCHGGR